MEKRTILAVVLSVVVIVVFYLIQGLYTGYREFEQIASGGSAATTTEQPAVSAGGTEATAQAQTAPAGAAPLPAAVGQPVADIQNDPGKLAPVVIETDVIRVEFSNAGGDIVSYQLKEHLDNGVPVEMVLGGTAEPHAFSVVLGSREDVLQGRIRPLADNFAMTRTDYSVTFTGVYLVGEGETAEKFTLTKRYDFKPGEYLFELTVTLDGGSFQRFDFHGAAYTLLSGPQIGPHFAKLDQRAEFRQYLTYNNNKVRQERINTQAREVPAWTAIVGKYFGLIAVPTMNQFDVFFSDMSEAGLSTASRLLLTRSAVNSSRVEDKYYFYLGPKKTEILETYYNGKNNFSPPLHGFQLQAAAKTQTFLSIPPLENLLKWILMLIYRIIPNYGIAIIVLTLLVKGLLFPLTRKSSESTLRMQTLSPKIKEIQEKYKDNSQKMNLEMAEFYKKEGYNPLSGCLPMLIQMPIFFAMYNLFNNHFDLRGAMFIPGWIPDLSLPESIFNFAPVTLPILGWSDIRLLPFLYVGSQLLYGKVTQTPDQRGNNQMKLMLYAMPIIFFFILYDVPSGLLLYWIMSNILTMVQQIIINRYIAAKKAAGKDAAPTVRGPVIAPKKKRKK